MLNLHFSLLPRWRGAAPVERAILAGDAETGVCLMKVEEGLDTGPVYARHAVPIDEDDDARRAAGRTGGASCVPCWSTRWPTAWRACPSPSPSAGRRRSRQDHARGPPPRLGHDRRCSSHRVVRLGSAWTTFRGRRLSVLEAGAVGPPTTGGRRTRPRPGTLRRRPRSRRRTGPSCCDGCSPRAVPPCQPTTGSAGSGPRPASGSGPTKHECSDCDSDRRVEPRPVRAVPLRAAAALRRPAGAVPSGARRARRRPRVRDRRPHQDPARGDGGEGDGRHRLLCRHADAAPRRPTATCPACRSCRATSRPGSARASTSSSPTPRCNGSTTT